MFVSSKVGVLSVQFNNCLSYQDKAVSVANKVLGKKMLSDELICIHLVYICTFVFINFIFFS